MYERFAGKDITSISEFTKDEILFLLEKAQSLKETPRPQLLQDCILGSCFFEPSTRTRLSFEAAMSRLGGRHIGFSESGSTSVKKGESLSDTIRTVGCFCDVIVVRHPLEGAARLAAEATDKPVINAGDGANQHPTQTLLDLFTIRDCQNGLDGLSIGFMGDLRYGRTVHSLAAGCSLFGHRLYFVSPPELEMPDGLCDELRKDGACFSFHRDLREIMDRIDILYVTRLQRERANTENLSYALNPDLLEHAKPNLKILHPLPRVDELPREIDDKPQSYYFHQVQNGLYVRQALLALVLGRLSPCQNP